MERQMEKLIIVQEGDVLVQEGCSCVVKASLLLHREHYPQMADDDYVIMFDKGFYDSMSEDDLECVVEHERGHIHHHHMEMPNITVGTINNNVGIMVNMQAEIEADLYAVARVGKEAYLRTLTNMCRYLAVAPFAMAKVEAAAARCGKQVTPEVLEKYRNNVFNYMAPRFDAVRNAA